MSEWQPSHNYRRKAYVDKNTPPEPPKEGDVAYNGKVHDYMRTLWMHDAVVKEHVIAIEELRQLGTAIEECVRRNTVNAPQVCRPLLLEYRQRTQNPYYLPDEDSEFTTVVDRELISRPSPTQAAFIAERERQQASK
jgi:hypothetical protein